MSAQQSFRSDQSLSRVRLFATPWITAHQASLSITNSQSSLRFMSIGSVMPSSHLILCHPLLLLPPIPPSIRVFSSGHVWMWELDCEESWAPKNWCFWTVVLEQTLESPLDCREIQPVHSEGDQPWDFFGRNDAKAETSVLSPHAKCWLTGKDSDAGRDWGQEEKGMTEDEMAGWHHWLDGRESESTPGVGDGQGGPGVLRLMGSQGVGHDWVTELNWRNLSIILCRILAKSENCALLSDAYGQISYSSQDNPSCSVWKPDTKKRDSSVLWVQLCTLNDSRPWNSVLTFLLNFLSFWVINLHSWLQMLIYILKALKYLSLEYHSLQFSLFKYIDICKYG